MADRTFVVEHVVVEPAHRAWPKRARDETDEQEIEGDALSSQARGDQKWTDAPPGDWNSDVDRFFRATSALDAYLASDADVHFGAQKIFQGAIADSLTHVGQVNMLRRIASSPVRGENYSRADIAAGRVSLEQPAPRAEFD